LIDFSAPRQPGGTPWRKSAEATPVAPRLTNGALAWRFAAHAAWIAALAGLFAGRAGRFGFGPTDQGFVLSLSWRVLNGAIPHVDLISARPLGSAYLFVPRLPPLRAQATHR
jgi:hypothetical protein